jgi:sulfur carrier protein
MALSILVNGTAYEIGEGSSVADLVAAHELEPTQVAVELNREIVPRGSRGERLLVGGDRVELVTLVGGG